MIYNGGKVLVQERKKQDWPGIAFPGGHVEAGESFTEAVIREVWEETGLTISSPRLCGIKDWQENGIRYVVFLYKTERSVPPEKARFGGRTGKIFLTCALQQQIRWMYSVCLRKITSASFFIAKLAINGFMN